MERWVRKAVECSEFSRAFCVSLAEKNAERNTDNGVLACKISEGSNTLPGCFYDNLYQESLCPGQFGLKDQLQLAKDQHQ